MEEKGREEGRREEEEMGVREETKGVEKRRQKKGMKREIWGEG